MTAPGASGAFIPHGVQGKVSAPDVPEATGRVIVTPELPEVPGTQTPGKAWDGFLFEAPQSGRESAPATVPDVDPTRDAADVVKRAATDDAAPGGSATAEVAIDEPADSSDVQNEKNWAPTAPPEATEIGTVSGAMPLDESGAEAGSLSESDAAAPEQPSPEAAPASSAAAQDAPTPETVPAEDVAERAESTVADTADAAETGAGLFSRLRRGLGRTSDNLVAGLGNLFLGRKSIDDDLLEDIESQLLMADVGIDATTAIIDQLTARVSRSELADPEALLSALREELAAILEPCEKPLEIGTAPFVLLVVGVNGVGKTTTIGKMARRFQAEGRSVMLAAGDTFRAAAVEQLQHWGERHDVPVIAQHQGADSASVIFDALQAATARGVDVLIADTAGRLSNKSHLMDELAKVVRVLRKLNADAPHEVLLVLDAGTGQNALAQADQFREAVGVTGLALTKLDGTAKGGVIFAIARKLGLPIRFIGVGEGPEDLRPFEADDFIRALFDRS
ncbi:MAG: signal recognition particle-docking protein FtsY [Pseudomonadota bacterium]